MTPAMPVSMAHNPGDEPNLNALAAFADGGLSEQERASVVEHLASCGRCRTIAAELAREAAGRQVAARWPRRALPIAASVAIAIVGGGLFWLVRDRGPSRDISPPPAAVRPAAPAQPRPSAPERGAQPLSSPPPAPRPPEPPDRLRASATRSVAGKSFRLVAGEWVDVDYRLADAAAVVDVRTPEALAEHEQLRRFADLGRRFTVLLDGTAYRVDLP